MPKKSNFKYMTIDGVKVTYFEDVELGKVPLLSDDLTDEERAKVEKYINNKIDAVQNMVTYIDDSIGALVKQVQAHFNIFLPVSGGMGSSVEDSIVLDIDNANLIAPLEHAVLHYLSLFRGHTFDVADTDLDEGERVIEKFKTTFSNDAIRFHSYYFDITRPWHSDSKPLTISGNPYFPDSEIKIHS